MSPTDGERSAPDEWRTFCQRLADIGSQVLTDAMVTSERDEAEGLRTLARQVTFALQHAMEFSDTNFPAMHRFDDDVTKWGGPNADNNYLRCAIDPGGTYRLTADIAGCRELILSLGDGDMQLGQPGVHSERTLSDLSVVADRLDVTVSPAEHPGNWMPTVPSARQLSIRVYVVDWANDAIPDFYVERLDVDRPRPEHLTTTRAAHALDQAAAWVEGSMPFWLRYIERARAATPDNVLSPPMTPPGGSPNIAYGAGYWDLGDEEAWIITFDQPDAFHWSIQTHTWPWFESGDLAHAQTSLNDHQSHVDADGRVRVVVSSADPGVPNWIDTEGRPVGMAAYRWIMTDSFPVPSGEVVGIADVATHLPSGHPTTTPEQRLAMLGERRRSVHRRFRR